jgi:hypothetical protein
MANLLKTDRNPRPSSDRAVVEEIPLKRDRIEARFTVFLKGLTEEPMNVDRLHLIHSELNSSPASRRLP